jgi:hypothetical protein
MSKSYVIERNVGDVVRQYVMSRRSMDNPISTAHAVRAIRTALPNCSLTDRELVNQVAATAIEIGYNNIAFDAEMR